MISKVLNSDNIDLLYDEYHSEELLASKELDVFEQKYPNTLTHENINDVLKTIFKKRKE